MQIKWRQEMAVDNGLIDRDHKALIAIINEFCAASPGEAGADGLRAILTKLDHYSRIHFGREESLQVSVRYPYHDAHHKEHEGLLRRLSRMRAVLDNADGGLEYLTRAHADLEVLLRDWLIEHILRSDRRMSGFSNAMAPHASGLDPLAPAEQVQFV